MQIDKNNIIKRINELIDLGVQNDREDNEVVSGTIAILEQIYGTNSQKTKSRNPQAQENDRKNRGQTS